MKHIIIVGKGAATNRTSITVNNGTVTGNAKIYKPEPVVANGTTAETRINCLNTVIETMNQIISSGYEGIVKIHTIGMVKDFIDNGTAVYWLDNGGKTMAGKDVNETELSLWAQFYQLSAQLSGRIVYGNVSTTSNYGRATIQKSEEQRAEEKLLAEYITQAWEDVKARQQTAEAIECADI